ncbi:MAG TPA: hypothetical protein VF606_07270 [Geminicoccaceae bacterium]
MGEATAAAVICERLGDHGELRAYRRPGPPEHIAFEILREADGRAWTLRVPWEARSRFRDLLGEARERLGGGEAAPDFDEQGCAELAKADLGAGEELVAVLLEQGGDRAFAVWRRELAKQGWNWTLDVVVAPAGLAAAACGLMLADLDRLDGEGRPGKSRYPGPRMPASSASIPPQPPRTITRSISRR